MTAIVTGVLRRVRLRSGGELEGLQERVSCGEEVGELVGWKIQVLEVYDDLLPRTLSGDDSEDFSLLHGVVVGIPLRDGALGAERDEDVLFADDLAVELDSGVAASLTGELAS